MSVDGRLGTDFCFHLGFQPSVTQQNLAAPDGAPFMRNRLNSMLLGVPGCRVSRTENPRVGSSILSLATILIRNLPWQPSRSERRCFHFVSELHREGVHDGDQCESYPREKGAGTKAAGV